LGGGAGGLRRLCWLRRCVSLKNVELC
jgi:hypothetical protein